MKIQTALQSKAPGTRGEYSFVKVFPFTVLVLDVLFIATVLIADVLGRTEYGYWMNAMMFTTITIPVSLVPLLIQLGREKHSGREE